MTKFIVLRRIHLYMLAGFIGVSVLLLAVLLPDRHVPVSLSATENNAREISMLTVEYKSTTADGKSIESYRWDPGTIYAAQGETIRLRIMGVNGEQHPFTIEGYDVTDTVVKGKETIVTLKLDKKGIFRIICHTHTTAAANGPMIAHLIVN